MSKEEKECVVDKLRRGVRQAFVNLTKVGLIRRYADVRLLLQID
jgi:hypothetical protein